MNEKLTALQMKALNLIAGSPNQTGFHWQVSGIGPQTIAKLWDQGLVSTPYDDFVGEARILHRRWHITDEGRAALAGDRP